MTTRIRPAGLFDIPEIVFIQRAAIDMIDDRSYAPDARRAWRDRPSGELSALVSAGCYRVGDNCGVLVGGAGWQENKDGDIATVRAVFVHPAMHGRGVGAALVTAIETELRRRGFTHIVVPAALNAVGFYERLGYRAAEIREAEFDGVRLCYRRMVKDAA